MSKYKKQPKKKAVSSPKKKSTGKMRAIKKEIDGIKFDSTMEADYYEYLKAEKEAGRIKEFSLQPKFPLQEAFKKYGRTIRAMMYIADFKVKYADGTELIIDVKGRETADFKLKRKLFDYKYIDLSLKLVIWDKRNSMWADYDEFQKAERLRKKKNKTILN